MSDDLSEIRRQVAVIADTASGTKTMVESLRSQTAEQWSELRDMQSNSIRQSTILERVVVDQNKLAETIKTVEDGVSEYRSDKKALGMLKWFAGIGGGAGMIAAAKTWLGLSLPPGGD